MRQLSLRENPSQNRPFMDGNKRAAIAAPCIFLSINGLGIVAIDEYAQIFVLGLYDLASLNFENLRAWLLENTKAI